ncbi:hypothetical protein GCM10010306_096170 [Streptomyces umbrinus]|nr:hypothetical protein GCM10010306_096170 [Streptomyces umbrinus]
MFRIATGALMADALNVPVSRNTLLRLIASLPDPATAVLRMVGVHTYTGRTGRVHGTALVDVETRRPVDLLPDREADTLAAWLAERPGIGLACRWRFPPTACSRWGLKYRPRWGSCLAW